MVVKEINSFDDFEDAKRSSWKRFDTFRKKQNYKLFRYKLFMLYPTHCRLCKSVKKKIVKWSEESKYSDVGFYTANVDDVPSM